MIYLDNAATTWPKPPVVQKAMNKALVVYGANPGRSGYEMSIETSEQIFCCRETACKMFGAESEEQVCFTSNCTLALNMAIKGIIKYGDHVITSCFEHNAVMRPLTALRDYGVITYDISPVYLDDDATVNAFEALIRPTTKLIVCTHVSNVFGIVLPIGKIGAMAKARGVRFVVDAAQSAGVLPINMQEMEIDCLCMPGHKGLYGPMGTGMMIARDGSSMATIIEGGTGSASESMQQPDFMPDRFESGTLNVPGIIALNAGMHFVNGIGMHKIHCHEMELMQRLYDGLKKCKNVRLYTQRPEAPHYAPVLSFNVGDQFSTVIGDYLGKNDIAVRAGYQCAPLAHKTVGTFKTGTVRACPSVYSTYGDIDHLLYCISRYRGKGN